MAGNSPRKLALFLTTASGRYEVPPKGFTVIALQMTEVHTLAIILRAKEGVMFLYTGFGSEGKNDLVFIRSFQELFGHPSYNA